MAEFGVAFRAPQELTGLAGPAAKPAVRALGTTQPLLGNRT